jgi:toxin ParE1/3/4
VRVSWIDDALRNIDSIAEYITQNNPEAAFETVSTIFEAVDRLQRSPSSGRTGRLVGTRELVVPGAPYVVPYRVRGNVLEILRVFHPVRKWPDEV